MNRFLCTLMLVVAASVALLVVLPRPSQAAAPTIGTTLLEVDMMPPQWQAARQTAGVPDLGVSTLAAVNRAVNQVPYIADAADRWLAPGDFFARGGDCEDYALAKMAVLQRLGVDPAAMWVLVLDDPAHAVLLVDTAQGLVVLDNLHDDLYRPSDRLLRSLVYVVNDTGMWITLSGARR